MSKDLEREFIEGYESDPQLSKVYKEAKAADDQWIPGQRFFRNKEGLLFFRDEGFRPRLCVPRSKIIDILTEAHENPLETAHLGPEKLWDRVSSRFYWKRMKTDL